MSVPTQPATNDPSSVSTSVEERAAAIFGSDGDRTTRRNRSRIGRRTVVAVAVASIAVLALVTSNALGADAASYQLGAVAVRDVASTWTGVATIEAVAQASVSFPVSGTVKTVEVSEGDTVVIGQTLATLDPEALDETLHQKQSALAQAELTLSKALDGENVATDGAPQGSSAPAAPASTGEPTGQSTSAASVSAASGPSTAQLAQAQQAVLQAQQRVDAALAAASTALSSATTVCAAVGGTGSDASMAASDVTACQTALQEVLVRQQEVAAAQSSLADASNALDALLSELAAASSAGATGSVGGSGTSPTGGGSTASSSPSAADLAKFQQAVDAAAAEVVAAQQATDQTTIVSPIAGKVVSVELEVGDEVTAGSDEQRIVVVGAGGYEATTTVGVDDIGDVVVGQAATVVPDGAGRTLHGQVVAISVSPDESASSTSYRVTVALVGQTDDLRIGSTGSVAVDTERAEDVLAVPTSAVSHDGDRATVRVLEGSDARTVDVEVGAVGDTWTEITDGLTRGQRVVLADRDQPLPSSATDSSSGGQSGNGFGPPGGFPGGGRPGG